VTRNDPAQRFIRLAATVRAELELLERVALEARLALTDFASSEPPLRELRGIGNILHDLYTGTEHIFEKISSEIDGGVPNGSAWHRELLESMALELPGLRPAVLTPATVRQLEEFLRFRHLYRNVYGFELEWTRLRPLLMRAEPTWAALRADVVTFLSFLDALGHAPKASS
jgi:hypothetical protein